MALDIGTRLGSYQLTGQIGQGGMGVVYEALDTDLDRMVALKVVPDEMAGSPERLQRFRREAKALAALNHPNIVTIHGVEESDGRRFLIMERVEGDSLDRVLSPGGLALDTVFDIAIPIADALAAAHAKGIVHRDLKPANVMVAPDGRVKLLDFGLARPTRPVVIPDGTDTSERVTRSLDVTRPGEVMGTAPYMSPEQLQGHDVDSRSDLFSLGIVLYEMVSGARPFQGGSGAALVSSILTETPPSLTDRRPDVPKHLGRIVQQCLEKDPESRFQTAKDVRNQLQTLRKEMEAERTASLPQQAGTSGIGTPRSSTRPVAVAVAALAVAAVSWLSWQALGGGTTAPETTPAALETTASVPKIVVLPFENLGAADDEYFADGMTDEIRSRLSRLDGLRVMSRASAVKYKGAPVPMRQLAEELGVDYVLDGIVSWQPSASGPSDVRVTAEVIQVADDTALWTASYDAVLANPFEVQSQIATQVIELLGIALVEPERAALAARPTENLEAYDLYLQGTDYLHAAREVISVGDAYFAIQLLEAAVERDPAFALAYVQLSVAHSFLWEMWEDRSDDRAALAREAVEAALVLDPALPEAHFARGLIYAAEDQRERAIEEYRTLLVRQPNNAEVYEALSKAQTELGRFEDAYASLVTAAELSPRDGRIECWAGGQMFALREFDEAIAHHRRALQLTPDRACPYVCTLDIYVNADGNTERARRFLEEIPDGVDLEARPPINYSWVMIEIIDGRYDAAIERLSLGSSQVYEFKNYYVPKDSLRAQVYGLMGRAELERQHYEAARVMLETRVAEVPDDRRTRGSLGIVYAALGRRDDAVREGELALELLGEDRGENLGYQIKGLAQIYVLLGEYDRAIEQLERLLSTPTFFAGPLLGAEPTWEPLRAEPRFQALIGSV